MFYRRMLRFDEEEDHRRRLRVHVVVRHRRATTVARGYDIESRLRERGNCTRCTTDCHWCSTVQDHEG